jgi:hypothetical protein
VIRTRLAESAGIYNRNDTRKRENTIAERAGGNFLQDWCGIRKAARFDHDAPELGQALARACLQQLRQCRRQASPAAAAKTAILQYSHGALSGIQKQVVDFRPSFVDHHACFRRRLRH